MTGYCDYAGFLANKYPCAFRKFERFEYIGLDRSLSEPKNFECSDSAEELSYRWRDVETALAIDYDTLVEDCLAYYYPDPMSDRSSTWHNFAIEIDLQTSFVENFTGKYFQE
ncbi:MAG: hypothetical protein GX962_03520 [Epulopiscium sp.]|nr:hypothetical protein [Candidatus Epulonipiscium sp.]